VGRALEGNSRMFSPRIMLQSLLPVLFYEPIRPSDYRIAETSITKVKSLPENDDERRRSDIEKAFKMKSRPDRTDTEASKEI
jgi:hypothetical protein